MGASPSTFPCYRYGISATSSGGPRGEDCGPGLKLPRPVRELGRWSRPCGLFGLLRPTACTAGSQTLSVHGHWSPTAKPRSSVPAAVSAGPPAPRPTLVISDFFRPRSEGWGPAVVGRTLFLSLADGLDPVLRSFVRFGAMAVTKTYKFIRFGAMVTRPYQFIGFGAMDVTKPNERTKNWIKPIR